jgi:hypothetical protein
VGFLGGFFNANPDYKKLVTIVSRDRDEVV